MTGSMTAPQIGRTHERDPAALDRHFRECRACRGLAARGGRPAAERRHRPGAAVLDNLERRAREALAAIPRSLTARDADRMRGPLRRELERSLGTGRLPWPPALRPRVVGTLRRDGYRIEKVVYESLPGAPVPAHLYVPEGLDGPAPAVLFYPGHWWPDSKARPDFQAFCINMARLGFVVLSFDPFGQGERGVSSRDHRRTEALLVGVAQQGFAEYETRCALEYLLSRPEVDPRRVGITGASGGGYNTWITAALDDRIAAAVPVVGTSEFAEQIHVCRPLDWYHASEHCHFVPGLIRYANNHELLAMAAPRPVLIIAASQDQSFPLAGVRQVADYGRTLYESYGAGDKTGLVVDGSEGHGYQRVKREAAYGWFLRWLSQRGDGRPVPGAPHGDAPLRRRGAALLPPRPERAGRTGDDRDGPSPGARPAPTPPRIDLGAVLGPMPSAAPSRVKVSGDPLQRLLIPSEEGLDIPAFLLRPAGEVHGLVVALDDRGKEVLASDPVVTAGPRPGLGGLRRGSTGHRRIGRRQDRLGVRRQPPARGELRRPPGLGHRPGHRSPRRRRRVPGKPIGLYARGQDACLAATYAIARLVRTRADPVAVVSPARGVPELSRVHRPPAVLAGVVPAPARGP